jgi:hypothetical protein
VCPWWLFLKGIVKVFVWKYIEQCSPNYHPEGGVVVFADSLAEAMDMANKLPGCSVKEADAPDEARDCADGNKKVFIMPDAGCC